MQQAKTLTLLNRQREKRKKHEKKNPHYDLDGNVADPKEEQKKYKIFWNEILFDLKETNDNGGHVGSSAADKVEHQKQVINFYQIYPLMYIKPAKDSYIIHPYNQYKVNWDIVICIFVIYSVLIIPFRIGFALEAVGGYKVLDWFITAIFFIDIVINFNVAYHDTFNETFSYNRMVIAKNYMKYWFWIDIVSTIPFDSAIGIIFNVKSLEALRIVRVVRLMRLLKLYRLSNINAYIQKLATHPSLLNFINLIMVILQIFFIAHLFACFWHYIGLHSQHRSWLQVYELADRDPQDRYIASLYYILVTMLTIGYGDIHPTNPNERWFAILTMLTGGIVFGALISKVTKLIEKHDPEAKAVKEKMTQFKEYLEAVKVPGELKMQAKDAYAYYLTKKSGFNEVEIYEELPRQLLNKLVCELYTYEKDKLQLFKNYEESFFVELIQQSKPFQANASEPIFREGDICNEIVFVLEGLVRITVSDVYSGLITYGGFFGDFEYLQNSCSVAKYTAECNCNLLSIPHSAFRYVCGRNVEAGAKFKDEIEQRYRSFTELLSVPLDKRTTHDFETMRTNSQSPKSLRGGQSVREKVLKSWRKRDAGNVVMEVARSKIWVDGTALSNKEAQTYRDAARSTKDGHDGGDNPYGHLFISETGGEQYFRVITENAQKELIIDDVSESALRRSGIIHPKEIPKLRWDLFLSTWIVYTAIVVPVQIAFKQAENPAHFGLEILIDCFFCIDIVLNFRTAYESPADDAYVIVPKMITLHYLLTPAFLIDVLSTIPFSELLLAFESYKHGSHVAYESTRLLKLFRMVRSLKLMRIFKLNKYLEKIEDIIGISPAVFDIFRLTVEVFVIGHLVACFWWGVTVTASEEPWFTNSSMVYVDDFRQAKVSEQYLLSLYFTFTTMTTVGYGDISATNTHERIINIVIIFLGASVFGYILANVSTLMSSFNEVGTRKLERLALISEFLKDKSCPHSLRGEIVDHFRNVFSLNSFAEEKDILSRLPQSIVNRIIFAQHESKMRNIAIFRHITNLSVQVYLFQLMIPMSFNDNEFIIRQGKAPTDILFLVSGSARSYHKTEQQQEGGSSKKRGESITKRSAAYLSNIASSVVAGLSGVDEQQPMLEPLSKGTAKRATSSKIMTRMEHTLLTGFTDLSTAEEVLPEEEQEEEEGVFHDCIEEEPAAAGVGHSSSKLSLRGRFKAASVVPISEEDGDALLTKQYCGAEAMEEEAPTRTQLKVKPQLTVVPPAEGSQADMQESAYGAFADSERDEAHSGKNTMQESEDTNRKFQGSGREDQENDAADSHKAAVALVSGGGGEGHADIPAAKHLIGDGDNIIDNMLDNVAGWMPHPKRSSQRRGSTLGMLFQTAALVEEDVRLVRNAARVLRADEDSSDEELPMGESPVASVRLSGKKHHSPGHSRRTSVVPLVKFNKMSVADMKRKKWEYIRDVIAGDIVGHAALMKQTEHKFNVRALEPCLIYALNKTEVARQIHEEPSVANLLKDALKQVIKEMHEHLSDDE